ncbi:hypothetical protein GIB67_006542 [Kingdonia uniflora]|uniref:Protein kinase domain-containing protein n=1 Tax=Kingdonia uniflora TaxID=39325 RepID=A0A7J7LEP5_9MAGN|nr:hypothetical protein GIB67_006542 [Kingdonia uniflora]
MGFVNWGLLLVFGVLWGALVVVSKQDDGLVMVALRRELVVSVWGGDANGDSNYCSWDGVLCNNSSSISVVEKLSLSHQQLRGNLSLISELKGLKWLDLSMNKFEGSIPPSFGSLSELEFLDLSLNKFGNSIPLEFGSLKNLRSLNLSNNFLEGSIPAELMGLESLEELQISENNLVGSISSWIGNLTKLRVFTAYENLLTGRIPNMYQLQLLNLHSNQLEGPIPESIFSSGKLQVLVLTMNKLSGSLPLSVGNCKGLSNLRIGDNKLVGSIPKSIGNVSGLTYFEVENNHLSGEIVPEFAQCSNLTLLNLAYNGFTGTIPSELGELMNLQEFILSGNSLFGDIPNSLLRSKNLSKLDLSNNRFNGTIPKDLCANTPRLQFLLLGQNSIKGDIPLEIGNCAKLLELQLGGNYLTGNIPPEIGQIKNLQVSLNLSFNHLHGPLPSELGKLDKLVSLDFSNNQLSGDIPSAVKGMMSLIEVNFSNNLLTGRIPIFVPLQKSPKSSFTGNKGLCGEPLNISCENPFGSGDEVDHHKVSYKIILVVLGSGLSVFVMVAVVVFLFMMRERQEKSAKAAKIIEDGIAEPPLVIAGNVFVENLKQAIDFDAVVKQSLKDSNKTSCGTFSAIYKAVMPSGLILFVKRLRSMDRTVTYHQNKMIRELERLGKLCHDHLMTPIGFVIYEDVALLLHHYLPNGTLAQYLHDSTTKPEFEPDWRRRLSIAIGAADGLSFLHHVATIHLDVASGNVFLDANFKPLVGEIEISKLIDPSRGAASISAVAGSFGYIPPEYAYTMQVTAPGNVYSYGVVLLEILTTRLPVDEAFGEGIDLVKWVHGAPKRGETPEQILDARLSTVSFAWRKQMLAVLKVALICTDSTPAKRPKMKKVVEMLKEINQS